MGFGDFNVIFERSLLILKLIAKSLKRRIFVYAHDGESVQCVSPIIIVLVRNLLAAALRYRYRNRTFPLSYPKSATPQLLVVSC
jgi:hypothetical protein